MLRAPELLEVLVAELMLTRTVELEVIFDLWIYDKLSWAVPAKVLLVLSEQDFWHAAVYPE